MKGATETHTLQGGVILVSIHAPLKGATAMDEDDAPPLNVSIHAPVKGATPNTNVDNNNNNAFQFTLP